MEQNRSGLQHIHRVGEGHRVFSKKKAEPICRRDILVTCKKLKADVTHVERFFAFLKRYLLERKL